MAPRLLSVIITMALLTLAAAGPAVAADGDKAKRRACILAAEQALKIDLHHAQFGEVVLGTSGSDALLPNPPGPTLVCGFKGADAVGSLFEGDIFVGGGGDDEAAVLSGGDFVGGSGDEEVLTVAHDSKFIGGPGDDKVADILTDDGVFKGGTGNDLLADLDGSGARFLGKKGRDRVDGSLCAAAFLGGPGNDSVFEWAVVGSMGRRASTESSTTAAGRTGVPRASTPCCCSASDPQRAREPALLPALRRMDEAVGGGGAPGRRRGPARSSHPWPGLGP